MGRARTEAEAAFAISEAEDRAAYGPPVLSRREAEREADRAEDAYIAAMFGEDES